MDARPASRRRVVIAGAASRLQVRTGAMLRDTGIAEPILVGPWKGIEKNALNVGADLRGMELVNASSDLDVANVSVELVRSGQADLLVKGHIHTSALLRRVLDPLHGLRTESRLSHVQYIYLSRTDTEFLVTDGALNISPDVRTKVDIVRNAVGLAHAIGLASPRVALLSATEEADSRVTSAVEAVVVKGLCQAVPLGASVFGPLAVDTALSRSAARIKGISNCVAGSADILVAPNIETGNAIVKLCTHLMAGVGAGVVLGAKAPIVLTSRADSIESRVASVLLALSVNGLD